MKFVAVELISKKPPPLNSIAVLLVLLVVLIATPLLVSILFLPFITNAGFALAGTVMAAPSAVIVAFSNVIIPLKSSGTLIVWFIEPSYVRSSCPHTAPLNVAKNATKKVNNFLLITLSINNSEY
mgnify:CR=1 FL=1